MTQKTRDCEECSESYQSDKPHSHEILDNELNGPSTKIMDSILENIGQTPLVRINKIAKDLDCEILAKCEFFNSGGSIKDRIGKRMVEDAIQQGRVKVGDTLIEPTSGNTGIGLALAALIRGLKLIITMPEKMSNEKVDVLKALGAEIIRTPDSAAWDSPESHIGQALRLQKEIKNSHILDQYKNPSNPLAHFDGTAEEILKQTNGKVDMIICGAGTGGTVSGIARKIRQKLPNCEIVGVDPYGSILASPNSLNATETTSYKVEGIGYDFIPEVLDRDLVHSQYKCNDKESFLMARRLISEEGLLCGGSSGSAMAAALHYAKKLKKGQRCVVILPDSIRNYMTKFLSDNWMIENGFADETLRGEREIHEQQASDPVVKLDIQQPLTVLPTVSCSDVCEILRTKGFDQIPVIDEYNVIQGMVTESNLLSKIKSGRVKGADPISKVVYRQFKQVTLDTTLGELSRIFEHHHFVLVTTTQRVHKSAQLVESKSVIYGIVTRIDLLQYIMDSDKFNVSQKSS